MSHLTRAAWRLVLVIPIFLALVPASAHAAAELEIAPAQVDFGTHPAGASADRTVTIRNVGPDATALTDVVLEGEEDDLDRFDFVDGTCVLDVPLAPEGECQITLRFATPPGLFGFFEVFLWAEGGPEDLPGMARLTAQVPSPPPPIGPARVVFDPSRLVLPDTVVGSVSAEQRIRVRNEGPVAVSGFGIPAPPRGDFTMANGCPEVLAAGAECSIGITFAPKGSVGPRTSSLRVFWDGMNRAVLSLRGTAKAIPDPYFSLEQDLEPLVSSIPKVLRGGPRGTRLAGFEAPAAGTLRVRVFGRADGRKVLVAHGSKPLASGATHRLRISSTAKGRKLLRRPRSTRVIVVVTYTDRADGRVWRFSSRHDVKPPKAKRPAKRKRR